MISLRYSYEDCRATADWILAQTSLRPLVGIVCGSGLGGLAEMLKDQVVFNYRDIPNFPQSTGTPVCLCPSVSFCMSQPLCDYMHVCLNPFLSIVSLCGEVHMEMEYIVKYTEINIIYAAPHYNVLPHIHMYYSNAFYYF